MSLPLSPNPRFGGVSRYLRSRICCVLLTALWSVALGRPFAIIQESNRRLTTHQLSSGGFTIGVTDYGGGAINQILMPGLPDISDEQSDRYGRMGQMAVRDSAHGGRYNPTQAGFYETLGTACEITETPGRLTLEPRGLALWHGDGQYDFTQWENIGPDPYNQDGGNTDEDGLDESDLSVVINGVTYTKQEAEVYSEYDFAGYYEDMQGQQGVQISAIRHYAEMRFIREPGHCVYQHRAGTKLWTPSALRGDLSAKYPEGVHAATDKELSNPIRAFRLRHDNAIWDPAYRYVCLSSSVWVSQKRSSSLSSDNPYRMALILAESDDPDSGRAIGLYRPESEVNRYPVLGIQESTGETVYRDARVNLLKIADERDVARKLMSVYGFTSRIHGLIARDRLPEGVYELWREELIFFYGTPRQIMEAIDSYEASKEQQSLSFATIPSLRVGDADVLLEADASSGLPLVFSSSDPSVARVEGAYLRIVGPGEVTLRAEQLGSRAFHPAYAEQSITVEPAQGFTVLPMRSRQRHGNESVDLPIEVNWGGGEAEALTYRKLAGPEDLVVTSGGRVLWSSLPLVSEPKSYRVELEVASPAASRSLAFEIEVWPPLSLDVQADSLAGARSILESIPNRLYRFLRHPDLGVSSWELQSMVEGSGGRVEMAPLTSSMPQFYRVSTQP